MNEALDVPNLNLVDGLVQISEYDGSSLAVGDRV